VTIEEMTRLACRHISRTAEPMPAIPLEEVLVAIYPDGTATCPDCDGAGEYLVSERVRHPVEPSPRYEMCWTCRGAGMLDLED